MVIRILPNPGSQQRITFSLESISTITFQARSSSAKIPLCAQHSSNHTMPCNNRMYDTVLISEDQPNEHPCVLCKSVVHIFLFVPCCEIQSSDILSAQIMDQLSFVKSTNDWYNHHFGWMPIFRIPPLFGRVHLAVHLVIFHLWEVY